MAWLSRVNFIASDTLSFSDINNLGNDIRAWGGNVNGGGYTLSNVAISATNLTASSAVSAFSLTANGGVNVNTGLFVTGGWQTGIVYVSGVGGMVVGTTSAHPLIVYANNAERMRILTTGEVGIGTASPANKFTVLSNGTINTAGDTIDYGASIIANSTAFGVGGNAAILNVQSNSTLGADVGGSIGFGGRYTGTQFSQFAIIRGAKENATDGNGASYLAFGTRINGGNITERMRIDSSGKVGIGTVSPYSQLTIIPGTTPTSVATATQLAIGESTNNALYRLILGYENEAGFKGVIDALGYGSGTTLLINPSGGNVGIGTTSPSWQTQVYGTGQNTALLTDAGSKSGSLFVGSSNGTAGAGGALLLGGVTANGVTSQWAIKSLITSVAANGTADLAFSTRAATSDTTLTERLRIFSSGQVSIGDTTAGTTFRVKTSTNNGISVTDGTVTGVMYASSGPAISFGSLTSGAALVVYSGNANVWTFQTNGSITSSTGASLTAGGVWTNASDAALKQGFFDINENDLLEKLVTLPIRAWEYIAEPGVKHIGPTSQDFMSAFGLGSDESGIGSGDAIGVLLACVKKLKTEIDLIKLGN